MLTRIYGNYATRTRRDMSCNPRKTLPLEKPTVEDYERWMLPNAELTHEDRAWKVVWLAQTDQMFMIYKETPILSTCASWIEPDLTFMLRVSLLDQ